MNTPSNALPTLPTLLIFPPGSLVFLSQGIDSPITARIVQIAIKSPNYIQYEIVWFSGNDRKTAWVEEFELKPHEFGPKKQTTIGFIPTAEFSDPLSHYYHR